VSEDDYDVLGTRAVEQAEHALDQRFAGQLVQNLVVPRTHTRPLTSGQHDRDQRLLTSWFDHPHVSLRIHSLI
jgi:hypothetical protein